MEYKNLNKIFKISSHEDEQIVLKVKNDDLLLCAKYPFINGDIEYITVTRKTIYNCYDYILTTLMKNGKSSSFHWGYNGCTLISEILELRKENVMKFIHEKYPRF